MGLPLARSISPGLVLLALLLAAALAPAARAQPHGLESREANTEHYFTGTAPRSVPARLSDAPWLIDLAKGGSATGVIPYTVASPLWSDYSLKTRFLALPELTRIGYRAAGGYEMPASTVLIKNFSLELERGNPASARLIETRLLVKEGYDWAGYSYQWDEAETDALLLPNERRTRAFDIIDQNGQPARQSWLYPSRNDCFACHTGAKNNVLGPETANLNTDYDYPLARDNQLRAWEHIGLFDAPLPAPPARLPRLVDPYDASRPQGARARSYLHVNCAPCHQPGHPTTVDIDFRFSTPLAEMRLLGVPQSRPTGDLGALPDAKRIDPGHPENSVLYLRMFAAADEEYTMPPLARSEIDPAAEALIRGWIEELGAESTDAGDWWSGLR